MSFCIQLTFRMLVSFSLTVPIERNYARYCKILYESMPIIVNQQNVNSRRPLFPVFFNINTQSVNDMQASEQGRKEISMILKDCYEYQEAADLLYLPFFFKC